MADKNLKSVKIKESHHEYLWRKSGPKGQIIETLAGIIESDILKEENKKFLPCEFYCRTNAAEVK